MECETGDVITIIFVCHSGPSNLHYLTKHTERTTYVQHHDWPSFVHFMLNMKATQSSEEKSFPHNMESGSTSDSGTTVTRIGGSGPAWAPLSVGPTKCGDWRLVPAMNGFQVRGGDSEEKSRWCWGHITARLQSSLCGGRADRSPLFWLSPAR